MLLQRAEGYACCHLYPCWTFGVNGASVEKDTNACIIWSVPIHGSGVIKWLAVF